MFRKKLINKLIQVEILLEDIDFFKRGYKGFKLLILHLSFFFWEKFFLFCLMIIPYFPFLSNLVEPLKELFPFVRYIINSLDVLHTRLKLHLEKYWRIWIFVFFMIFIL